MPGTPWLQRLREIRLPIAAPAAAWLAAAVSVFHRLPFGTSQLDESYYNAMPYAFAIGNRPYVDELGIFQNAGVMLAPLYRLYIAITGSGDGLILFNRYLYFTYSMACSVLAYRVARRLGSHSAALCIAALVASFAYFNLFALSYNTVGAFGFFCGVLCTASALLNPRPGRMLFVACLLFLSAVFAYPGLAPVVAVYLFIVLGWLFREMPRAARIDGLKGLGVGAVVALIGLGVLLEKMGGLQGLKRLAAFMKAMGYSTQGTLKRFNIFHLVFTAWRSVPLVYLALFVALTLACLYLKRSLWLVALIGAGVSAFCYWRGLTLIVASGGAIGQTVLPVVAPLCVALNRDWLHARRVMTLIWTPSLLSMVMLSYTSSNNFLAACLGVLGVMFATVLAFAAFVEQRADREPAYKTGYQLVFFSLVGSLFLAQTYSLYGLVYSETGNLAKCTALVHSGPSRGLKTGVEQAEFLEAIDRDLKHVASQYPEAQSITVFDNFAAGYMSTRLKPRTFSNWILWGFLPLEYGQKIAAQNFGTPEQLPDILVLIHQNELGRAYLQPYLEGHYKSVLERPEFDYVIQTKLEEHKSLPHGS